MTDETAPTVNPKRSSEETTARPLADDGSPESRYLLRGDLGAGAMAEVKLYFDRRAGREVAMKTALPQAERGGTRAVGDELFLEEARVQAQLEHPSIVPVYDLGLDKAGAPYFTMKRVRGVTLAEVLRKLAAGDADTVAKFSRRRLLTAFSNVCLAVHYAHSHRVVHRDLKPSNIMLDEYGELYVLDWGVARAAGERYPIPGAQATSPAPQASARTGIVGTPGFIAPEYLTGQAVDVRADVFSLGAILFEILALEPLYDTSVASVMATLAQPDARASVRAPHRDAPPELDAVCVKATAFEPLERYPSARALHDAVEQFLEGHRDLERRREAAALHASSAQRLADAIGGAAQDSRAEAASRAQAMGEVSRALALDPDNSLARAILVRLLTDPPRELPADAREEVERRWHAQSQRAARAASILFMSWFAGVPVVLLLSTVHHKWFIAVQGAFFVLAVAMLYRAARTPFEKAKPSYATVLATSLAIASLSAGTGPLFLVPGLALANAIAFILQPDRTRRRVIVAASCGAILLPAILEWVGLVPPSYMLEHGRMILTDRWIEQSRGEVVILFLLAIGCVIGVSVVFARFRDLLTEAEKRLSLQAWQLRQLVPASAQPSEAKR